MKLGNILNAAQFEIQNPVFHNIASDPSTPKIGQWYYNTTTNRMRYWSGSTGTGAGWIELSASGVQAIQLQGHVTGTWSGGIIPAVATRDMIKSQASISGVDGSNQFFMYDSESDSLAKMSWDFLIDYINTQIIPSPSTLSADTSLGDARIVLNSGGTTAVKLAGTTNEIEVALDGGVANRIIIGLPNSVVIPTLSVTNLTINGVSYSPYSHPTYSPLAISGSGLQFVQSIASDGIGSITASSLGTIPSASTTVVGVMRFSTNAEITAGTAGVAVQASQLASLNGAWGFKSILTGTSSGGAFPVVHNLGSLDVQVELYDQATGDTIYGDVQRSNLNTVTVTFGVGAPTSVVALIRRII